MAVHTFPAATKLTVGIPRFAQPRCALRHTIPAAVGAVGQVAFIDHTELWPTWPMFNGQVPLQNDWQRGDPSVFFPDSLKIDRDDGLPVKEALFVNHNADMQMWIDSQSLVGRSAALGRGVAHKITVISPLRIENRQLTIDQDKWVLTGPIIAPVKGNILGAAAGALANDYVNHIDTNIFLYKYTTHNWAGFGTDYNGNMWLRVGVGASAVKPALWLNAADYSTNLTGSLNAPTATLQSWLTIGGDLTISKANPSLILNRIGNTGGFLYGHRDGAMRWRLDLGEAIAETGGSAGSNFALHCWKDDGAYGGKILHIDRADGLLVINPGGTVPTPPTVANTRIANTAYVEQRGSDWGNYHASFKVAKTGDTMSGGLNMGSAVAPGGVLDLSRHLSLYGTQYGFSITGGTLNIVSAGVCRAWATTDYFNTSYLKLVGNGDHVRWRGDSFSVITHHNDSSLYFMVTDYGNPDAAGWNGLRPFRIDWNGNIVMSHAVAVGGLTSGTGAFSGALTAPTVDTDGVTMRGKSYAYIRWAAAAAALEVRSGNDAWDAFMSFHIVGQFACFFGLQYPDYNLCFGGWSHGDQAWQLWSSRDFGHPYYSGVVSKGYRTKQGWSAGWEGTWFNLGWEYGNVQLWVDDTRLGSILHDSDYRIKKDVVELPSMWNTVKALRPIKYTRADFSPPSHIEHVAKEKLRAKGRKNKRADDISPDDIPSLLFKADDIERWGFLAHELQDTLVPSAATAFKDAPDTIQSPDPFPILAALTKALQEAIERIEKLETKAKHLTG